MSYCIECKNQNIKKCASFGYLSDRKRVSCSSHRQLGMLNIANMSELCEKCLKEGKYIRASFGFVKDNKRISCVSHKDPKMLDLVNIKSMCKECSKQGKNTQSSFGFTKDKKKISCSLHKEPNMLDLTNMNTICKKCLLEEKYVHASFGFLTDKRRVSCSFHREINMIDLSVVNKLCEKCLEEGESVVAQFGFLSDKKKISCSIHALESMINLSENRYCKECLENGIKTQASYGFELDKKRIACSKHTKSSMLNLANINNWCKMCKEIGIDKRASYGFDSDKKRVACSKHAESNMVDLVSVNKGCVSCKEQDIFKIASFGLLFEKKTHCAVHKQPNEYSNNNPSCEECLERPCYGDSKLDEIPKRCEEHKKATDDDMIRRVCEGCLDSHFIHSSHSKCFGCLGFDKSKKNRKVKERKIDNLLTSLSSKIGVPIRDSRVDKGCSNKRPDFYYKNFNPFFDLIVEVDEFQHSKYTCGINGEFQRMINICEQDTGTPTVVIRFNPDDYYGPSGEIVKAYKNREQKLESVILGLKNRSEPLSEKNESIFIIYLFYDGFSDSDELLRPLKYKHDGNGNLIVKHRHPHSLKKKHIIETN